MIPRHSADYAVRFGQYGTCYCDDPAEERVASMESDGDQQDALTCGDVIRDARTRRSEHVERSDP